MVRKVIELPLVYNSYRWYSPEQKRLSVHYHRQIVKALTAADADRAELIMKEHLFEARDLLVAHVRAIQEQVPKESA
jgi:DNA-binding GntR family transcriptional regulator